MSKAFDTLNHELFIAKFHAYGFDKDSLKLLHSYLTNRWQRTKVNTSFSNWSELLQGVPQGSVLGPILFNIYLNYLFYLTDLTSVFNFADDTTFYACDTNLDSLVNRLEHDTMLAIEWFENNLWSSIKTSVVFFSRFIKMGNLSKNRGNKDLGE